MITKFEILLVDSDAANNVVKTEGERFGRGVEVQVRSRENSASFSLLDDAAAAVGCAGSAGEICDDLDFELVDDDDDDDCDWLEDFEDRNLCNGEPDCCSCSDFCSSSRSNCGGLSWSIFDGEDDCDLQDPRPRPRRLEGHNQRRSRLTRPVESCRRRMWAF